MPAELAYRLQPPKGMVPRLWYLEYGATLQEIGCQELSLLSGFFCFFHPVGSTGNGMHTCGRYSICRRCFCQRNLGSPARDEVLWTAGRSFVGATRSRTPTPLRWAARQCRFDLSYGTSLAGGGDAQALTWLNEVIRRSHTKAACSKCPMEDMVVLSVSDAACAAQPKGRSQGGLFIAFAHPDIQDKETVIAVIEAQSTKLQPVVRCSMAAKLSMAASAFEHGDYDYVRADYVRAVVAEMTLQRFNIKSWKINASLWRHTLVMDAKVACDAIAPEVSPTDRKLIVDIAVLRETLEDGDANSFLRWVPGREIRGDGLTKWNGNGSLDLHHGKPAVTTTKWENVFQELLSVDKNLSVYVNQVLYNLYVGLFIVLFLAMVGE